MKTLLFSIALTAITLSSCKKSSADATVTANLSVTIDGTSRTFNTSLTGALNAPGGGSQALQIVGWSGAAGSSDALYVSVSSATAITAKTYSDGAGASIQYIVGGTTSYANGLSPTNPISITITSITTNSATGTFKGDIFLNANSSSTKKVLTNGSFNVTF